MGMARPQILNRTHQMAVSLRALGFKNDEIAARVGLSSKTISKVLASPLAQDVLKDLRDACAAQIHADATEMLKSEVGRNIETWVKLRDSDKVDPNVRRLSAGDLMDRTPGWEKRTRHDEEKTIRLILSPEHQDQMRAALADSIVDVETTS